MSKRDKRNGPSNLRKGVGLVVLSFLLASPHRLAANNAGAVVLVNSQSTNYLDFAHYLQPYLGNFGVPCSVLDIASNPVDSSLGNYALIIIGHARLDTNKVFLTPAAQINISTAVSNGVGLVSFDGVLTSNNIPLYQFEQDIFGFGFSNAFSGSSVVFPATEPGSTMHYITALHGTNELLVLSNANGVSTMNLPGLTVPTNATMIATLTGRPFVVIKKFGQGRAVQWAGYDWMSPTIQGPMNGLDDLLWRGFVWSARKPFVMRGIPNFVTARIDDVSGFGPAYGGDPAPASPFWWVHAMTNAGFKPFLALFYHDIDNEENFLHDGRKADLRAMVTNGNVTCSIHSGSASANDFFYFNHQTESAYSDAQMSNNYANGTQWLQNNNIPSANMMIAHYSEMGANSYFGLTNWGVQFVLIEVTPGTVEYPYPGDPNPAAPWLVAGPYRLYEPTQPGEVNMPMYYADWLTIPGHPELNHVFFDCYTEIRNVGTEGEWAPADNDVAGSITRGYQQIKRGFDSLTPGNMFTHEFFIQDSDGPHYTPITSNHWQTILQGITSNIAPYHPIYVTMDYACQYVRATRTSQIISADFDPFSGRVTANFAGSTDLPINAYYYTGADSAITNSVATVSVFSGSTNVLLGTLPVLLVRPDDQTRVYGATNPPLTYSISGFGGTDTVAVVSGTAAAMTTADANSGVGVYPIVITNSSLDASNYFLAYTNGRLTVQATPPVILSISPAGATNFLITWSSLSNAVYRLQYSTDPVATNWLDELPAVTATNEVTSKLDTNAVDPMRIYRLVVP